MAFCIWLSSDMAVSKVVALIGLEVELAPEKSKMLLSAMLVWMFMPCICLWLLLLAPKSCIFCASIPMSESSFLTLPALSTSEMGDSEAVFRFRPLEVSDDESWLDVSTEGKLGMAMGWGCCCWTPGAKEL